MLKNVCSGASFVAEVVRGAHKRTIITNEICTNITKNLKPSSEWSLKTQVVADGHNETMKQSNVKNI